MTEADRKRAAKAFAEYWKDRGDEKSDSQSFWLSLARDVLGVAEPEKFILFEERVKLDHTSFIDGHIPSTHVLVEQKKDVSGVDKSWQITDQNLNGKLRLIGFTKST